MTNLAETVGFSDDQMVPLKDLCVPVWDAGVVHGVMVSEQIRTFGLQPFLLDRHFARWKRGLDLLGIPLPCDYPALCDRIERLIDHNSRCLPADSEQGVCFFATPGDQQSMAWNTQAQHSVTSGRFVAHSFPLQVEQWRHGYRMGVTLTTTDIRDVPEACWPKSIKVRSRLHYYLAQCQASKIQPGSYPILLDEKACVSDSAIGSLAGYLEGQGIIVRPATQRYDSISLGYVIDLANELDIPILEREFTIDDLRQFDEAFLVSTPWCIFPVASVDQREIGSSRPGRQRFGVFRRLMEAWSQSVGQSIA